jgi:hypothetical protein
MDPNLATCSTEREKGIFTGMLSPKPKIALAEPASLSAAQGGGYMQGEQGQG